MVSDRMLISIISMLVEALEMLCAQAADALAPRQGIQSLTICSLESLAFSVHLQEVTFILNPLLPFCHFFWSLTRLGLHELVVMCHLQIKPGLAHFDRHQLLVNLSKRHFFLA